MATILAANSQSVEGSLPPSTHWQQAMKRAIRSGRELCQQVGVPSEKAYAEAEADFPVFAPLEYVAKMRFGDAQDPLLQQTLATQAESDPRGQLDPVGDLDSVRTGGLLQKYAGRVLLVTTGACAIHCRYCFRRHFPYSSIAPGETTWRGWLKEIRQDRSIHEVILSGGDPLTVADRRLAWWVEELNRIEHVQRLRVHTRVPVVLPSRICPELLSWVGQSRLAVFFVLHFNHAQEIAADTIAALDALRQAGVTLLNQAVLLRGVNNTEAALRELCLKLVNAHVLPYYLHQLDPVRGAMHFEVGDEEARALIQRLRSQLPGYAVPKLVREIAGEPSKTPL